MGNKNLEQITYLYTLSHEVPEDFLKDKKDDFRLSRWCLKKLTNEDDLRISNHLHMKNAPEKLVSISHTKGLAACALCTNKQVKSIGVDIEWSGRQIREGSFKYFISEENELKAYSPLEVWCIKEAAFKAYFPFHDESKTKKILVLTDFTITQTGLLKGPNNEELSFSIVKHKIEDKDFLLALAKY